jgi:hypothetical protein
MFFISGTNIIAALFLYIFDSIVIPTIFYYQKFIEWSFYFIVLGVISMVFELFAGRNRTESNL